MSNELIRELAEALKSLDGCYCEAGHSLSQSERAAHRAALISARSTLAKARAYLASGGWMRVEDGLPVVPDGGFVDLFVVYSGRVLKTVGTDESPLGWIVEATHWRYAEPTPEAPKG